MSSDFARRFELPQKEQDIANSPHAVVIVTEDRRQNQLVLTTVIQSISREVSMKTAQGYVGTAEHVSIVHPMTYEMAFSLVNHVNHLPLTHDVRRRIEDVRELVEHVVHLSQVVDNLPQATVISLQRYTS